MPSLHAGDIADGNANGGTGADSVATGAKGLQVPGIEVRLHGKEAALHRKWGGAKANSVPSCRRYLLRCILAPRTTCLGRLIMPGDSDDARPELHSAPAASSDAFVSYSSQDTAVANALVEALEARGIRCWIAPRDVRAGAQYADAIVRAITGATAFVLVLSEHAMESPHVSREIERASSKRRPIFALRVDAAPLTPAFEYFLSESQWIEAQSGATEAAYPKLIDAIRTPSQTFPGTGAAPFWWTRDCLSS